MWVKIGGSLMRERLVKINFFYKIRWSEKINFGPEAKISWRLVKNGQATRKKSGKKKQKTAIKPVFPLGIFNF